MEGPRTRELIERLHALLDRLEPLADTPTRDPGGLAGRAWRWSPPRGLRPGGLVAIPHPDPVTLDQLLDVERQLAPLRQNLEALLAGRPANHALLWGARGTGKSSLIKALWNAYRSRGLALVEIDKRHLDALPELGELLHRRPDPCILFCDDLSLDADAPEYTTLKAALDGSAASLPRHCVVCATSNRRHLVPERMTDNLEARVVDGELHPGDASEERVSLSERFGLWIPFHPFDQARYLRLVGHWLERHGAGPLDETTRTAALRWALARGSRSGRVAEQFARHWLARGPGD